ncbi:MAG: hypothetical protein QF652_06895, partial [Dehalococcoidia bacterium]|nr:hypothetical protein [Dehalococcoidia bacterium]
NPQHLVLEDVGSAVVGRIEARFDVIINVIGKRAGTRPPRCYVTGLEGREDTRATEGWWWQKR